MYKRTLVVLLVIVALSSIITVFAFSNNSTPNTQYKDSSTVINPNYNTQGDSNRGNYNDVIGTTDHDKVTSGFKTHYIMSPIRAKKIALRYIDEPGAFPGTPALVKEDGKKIYIVPVVENKKKVGEIYLDAHNGKNLGGSGGAPP